MINFYHFCFQGEKNFAGSIDKNRICFQPMHAENILISANDENKPYNLGYKLVYNEENVLKDAVEAFVGLYQETGQMSGHNELTINPEQFRNGFTLFAFDISKTHSSSNFEKPGPSNAGNCTIKIDFRNQALTDNVVIYCLMMYQKSYALRELKDEIRNIEFFETSK